MTVDAFGRITDVTATATISANAFYGGTFDGLIVTGKRQSLLD